MTPYERYCAQMKERGLKPTMNEVQLHEAWGIKTEADHIPLVARKSATGKRVEPSLHNHGANKKDTNPPLKVNLLDTPKPTSNELLQVLENRLNAKKKSPKLKAVKPPKIKAVKVPKPPKVSKPKAVLKYSTPEEKRLRTNMLYAERMKKKREAEGKTGRFLMESLSPEEQLEHKRIQRKQYREAHKAKYGVKVLNVEEIERKKQIAREWYARNREKRWIVRNEYIATNPEARALKNQAVRVWEEKNREHRREYSRQWALAKRKKLREETLAA